MRRTHPQHPGLTGSSLALWLLLGFGSTWAASPPGETSPQQKPSPKDEIMATYLRDCHGKSVKDGACDKIRSNAVGILKEDLHTLGSTANRIYLPDIVRMFYSDEPELRIAAADAIGMIGPQDQDLETLVPLTNDPVPDVRLAVSNMISHGKGTAITLLRQRVMPYRTGRAPETPVDAAKHSLPVAPDSVYLFDFSDASVGRLSYVAKGKGDPAQFFKGRAKKGPYKWDQFKEQYRFQLQDEQEALNQAQAAAAEEMQQMKPPDPTDTQAFMQYMEKIQSVSAGQGTRAALDLYDPKLFGAPTVYILEERQIGQRSYPTRYAVVYQELAFKRSGYRLAWMTVPDSAIKTAQAASLAEEKEELANKAEDEALKKKQAELEALTKKKGAAEKKQFKKGQEDLEKALGF